MKILITLLVLSLAGCAAQYAFEKKKFKTGATCPEMVGTWYADVTVQNINDGKKRDITRLDRKADGTAYLRGISIYYKNNEVSDWEFPSKWSCDGEWYVESNEWGYTAFKIVALKPNKNILFDERNNMNAPVPIEIIEKDKLDTNDGLFNNLSIRMHLKL